MRVLIDECLDWRLARALVGHDCSSVARMGWKGISNGRLLALAQGQFDVFIHGDRNLSFQQNTRSLGIAIVVLRAPSTRLQQTLPLMSKLLPLLPTLAPGSVTFIE